MPLLERILRMRNQLDDLLRSPVAMVLPPHVRKMGDELRTLLVDVAEALTERNRNGQ